MLNCKRTSRHRMFKWKLLWQERHTNLWMVGTATQTYPPQRQDRNFYTWHNFKQRTTFSKYHYIWHDPILVFGVFSTLIHHSIVQTYISNTTQALELQTLKPGSSGRINLHLRTNLCPASLIIYEGIPNKVLETPLAWGKPQSTQIFKGRNSKTQIFI